MPPRSSAASSDQSPKKIGLDVTSNSLGSPKFEARMLGKPTDSSQKLVGVNCAGSLEDLLAEQRIAVERALAFNSAIVERLAKECPSQLPGKHSAQQGMMMEMVSKTDDTKQKPLLVKQPMLAGPPVLSKRDDMDQKPLLAKQHELLLPLLSDIEHDAMEASFDRSRGQEPENNKKKAKPTLGRKNSIKKKDIHMDMFPTLTDMKERVKGLLEDGLDGKDDNLYNNGFWGTVAQTDLFHSSTMVVIVLNTVWIAYDTDYNKADLLIEADWQFQVANNLFCTFFTCEMLIRLLAFKRMCHAFRDASFLWDLFLVAMMAWETWITSLLYCLGYSFGGSGSRSGSVLRIFRMFRLLRIARAARFFTSFPELMVLVKGMVVAFRSVMVVLSMLALIIYIFSIVMTQLLTDTAFNKENGNHFLNVPTSANFLLLQVLCGFDPDYANELLGESIICYGLFLLYLLIGSLTIMNMLIGILCDVVTRVAADEEEQAFVRDMEDKVDSLADHLDLEGNGTVTRQEFNNISQEQEVLVGLHELGVDVPALMDFGHVVFSESEEVSHKQFHHMILQFRDGKEATVKDVMELRMQISMQLATILQAMKVKSVGAKDDDLCSELSRALSRQTISEQDDKDKYDFYLPGSYLPGLQKPEVSEHADIFEEEMGKSIAQSSCMPEMISSSCLPEVFSMSETPEVSSLYESPDKYAGAESKGSMDSNLLTANDEPEILTIKKRAERFAAEFLQ